MPARRLNLGCGQRFHPDWVNADVVVTGPGVIACDLRAGIPFPAESFDVVYHSHVLEHLPRRAAPPFLAECHRVLRRGGVLRVVVPDLEQITRLYLDALDGAIAGTPEATARHAWMQIELCDQMTRTESGGEWARCYRELVAQAGPYIRGRVGVEGRWFESDGEQEPATATEPMAGWREFVRRVRRREPLRDLLAEYLLRPADRTALREGRFRQSGEVHRWMYDRVALRDLFQAAGFVGVEQRTALSSYLPDWAAWQLDTEPDGSVAKPDSLFMEARRANELHAKSE